MRRIAGGSSVIRENGPLASVARPAALPAFSAAVTFQITRRDPYRLIRPRGYLGIIVTILASGLALRSWLALIPGLAFTVVIIRRTACENQFLKMTLLGYTDYRGKVRYWLVPVMVRKTPVIAVTTETRLEGTRSSLSKATLGVQPSPTFCVMPRPRGQRDSQYLLQRRTQCGSPRPRRRSPSPGSPHTGVSQPVAGAAT